MDFLLWHHFGAYADERAHDLVNHYKHYFGNEVNAVNLARLTEQWIWRKAVDIKRETNFEGQGDTQTLKVTISFIFNYNKHHFRSVRYACFKLSYRKLYRHVDVRARYFCDIFLSCILQISANFLLHSGLITL